MSTTRRDEILGVATTLFARHGYRHTTLDAIAGACGLGKTAIYHYFDGKQAIFAAVVDAISDNVLESMRAATAGVEDPIDALVAAIRARFTTLRALSESMGVPDEIAQELGRLSVETRSGFYEGERKLLTGLLEAANAKGACRLAQPGEVAALLSASLKGIEDMLAEADRIETGLETLDLALRLTAIGLRGTRQESDV
ncbi:MAG: TetR/AcrR family transcriptional regulator [Deltaproteobacteria bacterium]|nr:TetR/AcrR family transcriptional regulator [Deltaproteobacteria bacterium]